MNLLFKRNILNELEIWKKRAERKPLMLRGARQVGKTTAVKMFAESFEHFIYIDLEKPEEKTICEQAASFEEFLDAIFFLKEGSQIRRKNIDFF